MCGWSFFFPPSYSVVSRVHVLVSVVRRGNARHTTEEKVPQGGDPGELAQAEAPNQVRCHPPPTGPACFAETPASPSFLRASSQLHHHHQSRIALPSSHSNPNNVRHRIESRTRPRRPGRPCWLPQHSAPHGRRSSGGQEAHGCIPRRVRLVPLRRMLSMLTLTLQPLWLPPRMHRCRQQRLHLPRPRVQDLERPADRGYLRTFDVLYYGI